MKFAEVNARFTNKVAEYIAKGYVINTATMNGSQGEIAKVDLTNGKEIIRVNLETVHGHEDALEELDGKDFWYDGVKLTVGRATDDLKPNVSDTWQTFWSNRIEVLCEEVYYRAGWNDEVLITREEAIEAWKKRCSRFHKHMEDGAVKEDITAVAAPIVHSFVRRQPKCSRVKLDVVKVIRSKDRKTGKTSYTVSTKNHSWVLK